MKQTCAYCSHSYHVNMGVLGGTDSQKGKCPHCGTMLYTMTGAIYEENTPPRQSGDSFNIHVSPHADSLPDPQYKPDVYGIFQHMAFSQKLRFFMPFILLGMILCLLIIILLYSIYISKLTPQ